MTSPPLAWPARVAIAVVFCAAVAYALLGHAIPWALARLPLAAPLLVFFAVALISVLWATADVLRGSRAA